MQLGGRSRLAPLDGSGCEGRCSWPGILSYLFFGRYRRLFYSQSPATRLRDHWSIGSAKDKEGEFRGKWGDCRARSVWFLESCIIL